VTQLLGNQPTGDFLANSGTHAPATRGLRFQVTETTEIGFLGWYRPTTGFSAFGRLLLYNAAGVLIRSADTVTDSGAVGWQWSPITTTSLTAGVTYTVAASTFTSGLTRIYPYCPRASRVAAPAPFIHDDIGTFANTTGPNLYPTTADNTIVVALSVQTGTGIDPGPGEGDPALTGDLGSWLSSDPTVQTHQADGLPWLTKVVADSIQTGQHSLSLVVDDIKTIVNNIPSKDDDLWTRITKLINIYWALSDAEAALVTDFLRRAPGQLTGPTPGGGSAFYGPSGGQVAERAEVAGFNSELLWHRTRTTNWLEPVPGEDWELIDTLEWDGSIGWDQPADCYVITITAFPPTWDQQDVYGHLWLPRAAWWAPLTGTLPHERHFVDFDTQILHALPMRCEGILLCPRENFAGTLQAWFRTTPPPSP